MVYLGKAIMLVDLQIRLICELMRAEQNVVDCPLNRSKKPQNRLQWTGSQMEFVELIYALFAVGRFNNGNVYLKELFSVIGGVFGINVKNFSLYFINIKNRVKGDRTKFLDTMKRRLMGKMEETDMKPSQK